ncbi:e3 ubiquitin-protein ligase RNF13 [Trichonephila clavipes]|nr:e3 ubiquitin-protein ligase RNF13 [Trichonephila clavipes]
MNLLRLNLDSSLKTTWFHSAAVQFPRARHHLKTEASRAAHVMGYAIPNVLQPGSFVWFEKTQGLLMKVLPVPGWRPMKQLAARVHFLRCDGLLDDWSVEGVLILVFVLMTSLESTGPNTSSKHNQSDLIDEVPA